MNEPSEHGPRKDVMDEDVDALGFDPAVSATGADVEADAERKPRPRKKRPAWRRRFWALLC